MQSVITRRLIAIAFLIVGFYLVLLFLFLMERGLWSAVPLILSIAMETFLLRCILAASPPKVELAAWVLTFIAWSAYHFFVILAHWNPMITGGGVGIERWGTATAFTAWIGSIAMVALCTKQANHKKP
jgi:hypothetical protein